MLYTTEQGAAKLGVTPDRLRRMVKAGEIVAVDLRKPGGKNSVYRFEEAVLDAYKAAHPDPPPGPRRIAPKPTLRRKGPAYIQGMAELKARVDIIEPALHALQAQFADFVTLKAKVDAFIREVNGTAG